MPKAVSYNKGTLRGTLARSEMVKYEGKNGKPGGEFLAITVDTGNYNKINATVFNTKANPTRAKDLYEQFKVGAKVEVVGGVKEKEYDKNGKKGIDRSIGANKITALEADRKESATFILQGIIDRIREIEDDGAEITLVIDTSYKDKNNQLVPQSEVVHLMADADVMDIIDGLDISKGDNVKFKGQIINKTIVDDYNEIIGSDQKYKIDTAEDRIAKEDITVPEEVSFI